MKIGLIKYRINTIYERLIVSTSKDLIIIMNLAMSIATITFAISVA